MKKLICALTLAATVAAQAATGDYMLYWQVSDSYVSSNLGSDFYGASLFATLNDNSVVELGSYTEGSYDILSAVPVTGTDITDYTSTVASFYIEFYNYTSGSWNKLGTSESWNYSSTAVQNAIVDFTDTKYGVSYSALSPSSFSAVPEPTSGMLMLLGLAGLALKRKRA